MATGRETDGDGRNDARQPDGRLVVYEGEPWEAERTGRWIVGDPVDVRR